jgi:hypothetical protein
VAILFQAPVLLHFAMFGIPPVFDADPPVSVEDWSATDKSNLARNRCFCPKHRHGRETMSCGAAPTFPEHASPVIRSLTLGLEVQVVKIQTQYRSWQTNGARLTDCAGEYRVALYAEGRYRTSTYLDVACIGPLPMYQCSQAQEDLGCCDLQCLILSHCTPRRPRRREL